MAIDGGMRKSLVAGIRLVASYRKQEHTAEVVAGEEGKLRFRLPDGREFGSLSAAGSAVMDGIACNGWRFWSIVADDEERPATDDEQIEPTAPPSKGRKSARRTAATEESGS